MNWFLKRTVEIQQGISTVYFFVVVSPRFELRQAEPKTAVLPLHHETIILLLSFKSGAKIRLFFVFAKLFCNFIAIIYAINVYCVDYSAIIK